MRSASLLLALLARSVYAAAGDVIPLPTNIEIDLSFPRNDTYDHAKVFPIVFALQGAAAAWNFGFHFQWRLSYADGFASNGLDDFATLSSSSLGSELPPSDPFILANRTVVLSESNGEHKYTLAWEFGFYANCSLDGSTFRTEGRPSNTAGNITFTTKKGAKAPDIAEPGACPMLGSLLGIQSNITGCPHIGDSGKSANPCAITVDAAMASSVSAAISATQSLPGSTTSSSTAGGTGSTASATNKPGGNHAGKLQANIGAVLGAAALLLY